MDLVNVRPIAGKGAGELEPPQICYLELKFIAVVSYLRSTWIGMKIQE